MVRSCMLSVAALVLVASAGWAQNGAERDGVIKLVDPDRGLAVMAFPAENGGIRLFEVPIPQDTKFVNAEGKKIADGLKDPMFRSGNNRLTIPVKVQYGTGGGSIKKITIK